MDGPLDLPVACRIQMQGLCTWILGVKFLNPAVEFLFQVIQNLPVLYQAVLKLQDIFLELASLPVHRCIGLYGVYEIHMAVI